KATQPQQPFNFGGRANKISIGGPDRLLFLEHFHDGEVESGDIVFYLKVYLEPMNKALHDRRMAIFLDNL
ncbi:hypothetical protein, partial [Pseudomonas aeruginosa]|uniref:hypothetical protein n=1 Tax=Pseudomonas aeruginosa TaxID=287 RepID=UPI00235923A3